VHADPPGQSGDAAIPEAGALPPGLARRLAAAGITDLADPVAAWRRLRAAEGRRTTGLDLYWLAAAPRGLAASGLPRDERLSLARSANPVLFPGFGVTPDSERPGEPVEIVPYDPDWPRRYAWWRDRLLAALGMVAVRAEHVGSTSVPGLAAKPIIDIQISVADVSDEARYAGPLETAGMRMRSRADAHRYFRPGHGQARDVHLHVCETGGTWERDHLLFRDYLRADPAARDAYVAAKRSAASTWRDDRWAYTEAKTDIILDILGQAERWARGTGWALRPPASPAP
jgi:GrpB-like predicted nucleotidyltransferase (UPF0157 family)